MDSFSKPILEWAIGDLFKMAKRVPKTEELTNGFAYTDVVKDLFTKHKFAPVNLEEQLDTYRRVSSGNPDIDEILGGGWAEGTINEIFGPEASGKTCILSWTYADALRKGIPCLHIDAEFTYNAKFAKQNGVNVKDLVVLRENNAEEIFAFIEECCKKKAFKVIGIDSLASLVPYKVYEGDMGDQQYSPLAGCMGRCIPRLNAAVAKSGTIIIFVNQLRENVGAGTWEVAEKTPGGTTLKFFASGRMDTRKLKPDQKIRTDMWDFSGSEPIQVGHILKAKMVKNKTASPNGIAKVDLWYRYMPKSLLAVKKALELEIIDRQKNKNGGVSNYRHIFYDELDTTIEDRNDYDGALEWIKAIGKFPQLLTELGISDFEPYILEGHLDRDQADFFLKEINKDKELQSKIEEKKQKAVVNAKIKEEHDAIMEEAEKKIFDSDVSFE
jgi:protein RecA